MRGIVLAAIVLANAAVAHGADVTFTTKATARLEGDGVRIEFGLSASTDVEVAVLDRNGRVVRHLAAGMLGPNAPTPFATETLKQSLLWDRTDDDGKPVPGPVTVRVRAGMGAELDRLIATPGSRLGPVTGLGVGANGEVYVLSNSGHTGAYLYVLSQQGGYLRTILPSPATLGAGQLKGIERLTLNDGSVVPIVYQANAMHLAPFLSGIRPQQLCVMPQGWIIFASGGNDYSDQSVPRHVLVLKPDGSTPPEVGFVGPSLGPHGRYSIGLRPQQLAVSPDGKTIYFAGMGNAGYRDRRPPKGIHTIGRLTWTSTAPVPFIGTPDEPGDDAAHLNSPVSLTTDPDGNIYVADAGNNRIAVFDAEGKPLGQTKVERPRQVCVHPTTGVMYVLTEPPGRRGGPFAVIKFDKALNGREVARLDLRGRSPVFALDARVKPPRLWLGIGTQLFPITDRGRRLEPGADVQEHQPLELKSPLFLTVDPGRDRLYVSDYSRAIRQVDLRTDTISPFLKASELAIDRRGNLYVLSGYGTNALFRVTPDGKPLAFSGTGSNKIEVAYRAGLPHVGVRGLTVAPNGDIYVFEEKGRPEQLHVFAPDGSLKHKSIIRDIPVDSANSVAVDRQGNIYVGINAHDPKALYPAAFKGKLPELSWINLYDPKRASWFALPQRGWPPEPFSRAYLNFYLYHYGSVLKFPPEGGRFWTAGTPKKDGRNPRPEGVPPGAKELRAGYLKQVVWGRGWLWRYRGFALNPNRTETTGDPACSCWTGRFALDDFGRLFVPDVFRFSVGAIDANKNEILRFGEYGNVDSAGPKSAIPTPAIPLGWANAVSVGDGKVYVADRLNRRIAVVNLTYDVEATCAPVK